MWDEGNSRPQKVVFASKAEYIVWGSNGPMPSTVSILSARASSDINPQNRIRSDRETVAAPHERYHPDLHEPEEADPGPVCPGAGTTVMPTVT